MNKDYFTANDTQSQLTIKTIKSTYCGRPVMIQVQYTPLTPDLLKRLTRIYDMLLTNHPMPSDQGEKVEAA